MRLGTILNYAGDFKAGVEEVIEAERAGLDIVYVPEAYAFDAISRMGYLAAKTTRVEIAAGVLPIYSRTPALIAMTAAGLDALSDGRFTLGLGSGGPQVIEGFHGVAFDAPVQRTREIMQVCRQVWRREPLVHNGRHYQIPLPVGSGTGLGKPLKLINHPIRPNIPILLAAMGPQNTALAAEIADGWQPFPYCPEKAEKVWGASLAEGKAKRDPALGPLDITATVPVAIGGDVTDRGDAFRHVLALYIGGMGAVGKNFYYTIACRFGYEAQARRIQELYLAGDKVAAAAAVPDQLLHDVGIIGPKSYVKERLAAYREAGVGTLQIIPLGYTPQERLDIISGLRELID
ncbi:LLM class F420-dependent oxidoreductase [Nocardia sp. NPDC051570]|uniref:LLM class F420-dependent oxidoreductase n=1 Tax=Nocardia sp. NPDC051570 TaxID=3364324 RepID=UPI0037921227